MTAARSSSSPTHVALKLWLAASEWILSPGTGGTLNDAINELSPKAVVLVGIAFGLDPVKQRLGDVIVAEKVM